VAEVFLGWQDGPHVGFRQHAVGCWQRSAEFQDRRLYAGSGKMFAQMLGHTGRRRKGIVLFTGQSEVSDGPRVRRDADCLRESGGRMLSTVQRRFHLPNGKSFPSNDAEVLE